MTELTQQRKERLRNEAVHEYLHGHGSVEDQFGQGFDKGYEAGRSSLESENAAHKKLEDVRVRAYSQEVNSLLTRAETAESENARLRELFGEIYTWMAESYTIKKYQPAWMEKLRAIRGGTNATGQ